MAISTQIDLEKIWAENGISAPLTGVDYKDGWVVEIPSYQHFNYLLKGLDTNTLVLAQKDVFDWQDNIEYAKGARVKRNAVTWYCHVNNLDIDPATDATRSYWKLTPDYVSTNSTQHPSKGVVIDQVFSKAANTWGASDITIKGSSAIIALNTVSTVYQNMLIGNIQGILSVVMVGNTEVPDNRSLAQAGPQVYDIYHEGNKPILSDIVGALGNNPVNGKKYLRQNSSWVESRAATQGEVTAGTENFHHVTPLTLANSNYATESYVQTRVVPTGSRIAFWNNSVPFGYVLQNYGSDYMLRVVGTVGGGFGGNSSPINFTHTHSTGSVTLTAAQIPSHSHNTSFGIHPTHDTVSYFGFWSTGGTDANEDTSGQATRLQKTNTVGGGGAHNHGNTNVAGWTPRYLNCIVGVKVTV